MHAASDPVVVKVVFYAIYGFNTVKAIFAKFWVAIFSRFFDYGVLLVIINMQVVAVVTKSTHYAIHFFAKLFQCLSCFVMNS